MILVSLAKSPAAEKQRLLLASATALYITDGGLMQGTHEENAMATAVLEQTAGTASGAVERLRATFESGRTRPLDFRLKQLEGLGDSSRNARPTSNGHFTKT